MHVLAWLHNPGADILLLGGTGNALKLAQELINHGYPITYSIAGLVRQPRLPCKIITGGFTQYGGMTDFAHTHHINLIIDATHPYAAQISQNAATTARECGIPCWRLQRPAWEPQAGDCWQFFSNWRTLADHLLPYRCIFLSHGRLSQQQLNALSGIRAPNQQFTIRTAVPITLDLPEWVQPLEAIGPFRFEGELELLQRLGIDSVVSKNSGGAATYGKIQAARELGIPVLMLQRPDSVPVAREFANASDLLAALATCMNTSRTPLPSNRKASGKYVH